MNTCGTVTEITQRILIELYTAKNHERNFGRDDVVNELSRTTKSLRTYAPWT